MGVLLQFLLVTVVVLGGVSFVALLPLLVGLKTGRIVITYKD